MQFRSWSLSLLWLCVTAQEPEDVNATAPLSTYISRPDLLVPAWNVTIANNDPETGFQPGYIFVAPYNINQTGPYIFDKFGNLVWSGHNETEAAEEINTHALQTCEYDGSMHLCMWKGEQRRGYGRGELVIMDRNYDIVKRVQTGNGAADTDMHEAFVINRGKTALLAAYGNVSADLSDFDVDSDEHWIQEGIFQEVDVETGEVLFEWHSSDHIPVQASWVTPGESDVVGNGTSEESPWDYFHINSIDKSNKTGDYIISARHVSACYAIDGRNGSVKWTLGYGQENNSFAFENFNFTFQHDARWVEENDTHTVISILDNASNGLNETADQSSGMIISLDMETMTATLIEQTFAPREGGILAHSQANYQLLENGGTLIGWGAISAVSETNADGEYVYYGTFGDEVPNYRSYTSRWSANPPGRPTMVVPPQNESSSTQIVAWVSWNGATEIETWRFWGSNDNDTDFSSLGNASKVGFETRWESDSYHAFLFAEAVSEDGESLGNSSVMAVRMLDEDGNTFVPDMDDDDESPSATGTGSSPEETGAATAVGLDRSSLLMSGLVGAGLLFSHL